MKALDERDREVFWIVGQGVPDLEVCREFGLLPSELEDILARVARRAEEVSTDDNVALLYERVLRKRAENHWRSTEARFHALLESSPDGVLVVNALTGIIRQANSKAADLFGYRVDELVGLSVEEIVPPKLRRVHPAMRVGFLTSVRKRAMGYHPPIFACRSDGSEIELAIALTATTAASDEDVMVVCTEFARWKAGEALDSSEPAESSR